MMRKSQREYNIKKIEEEILRKIQRENQNDVIVDQSPNGIVAADENEVEEGRSINNDLFDRAGNLKRKSKTLMGLQGNQAIYNVYKNRMERRN